MVHTLPLPGSPQWQGDFSAVLTRAKQDAEALLRGGCDAILIENMGDNPYLNGAVDSETLAAFSIVCHELSKLNAPFGIQLLAGANDQALAVASITGASFIRVEAFAYGHVADEGWMDACAGPLLRRRAVLNQNINIWADVQKKHAAHNVTADLSIQDLAHGHKFAGADALIITGASTGVEASHRDIIDANEAGLPVYVGSGITIHNIDAIAPLCTGVIVGSFLKEDGDWRKAVDITRVKRLASRLT